MVNMRDVRNDAKAMEWMGGTQAERENRLAAARIEQEEWEMFGEAEYMKRIRRKIPLYRIMATFWVLFEIPTRRLDHWIWLLDLYANEMKEHQSRRQARQSRWVRPIAAPTLRALKRVSGLARRIGLRLIGVDEIEEMVIVSELKKRD